MVGGAGAAFAEDQVGDDAEKPVRVVISPQAEPPCESGTLSLSVDTALVDLLEEQADEPTDPRYNAALPSDERWFIEKIEEVVVEDTRCAEQIGEGVFWSVQGVATDFAGSGTALGETISPQKLGWEPAVLDDTTGLVVDGGAIDSHNDGPGLEGLLGREIMYQVNSSSDDEDLLEQDVWTAEALLRLKVDDTVVPGTYLATLKIGLFE
jgi:hypothetical protein